MASQNSIMFIQIPGSINGGTNLSTSLSQELRGLKLFRAIGRKLSRKSQEDLNNEDTDSRCSSSDSCHSANSSTNGRTSRSKQKEDVKNPTHKHSVSMENFKKIFEGLSLDSNSSSSRSQSCSGNKQKRMKKSSPKRILRSPVSYTYVKGLSGLPTQRIPRSEVRIYTNGSCRCSTQCIKSLNR